MMTRFGVSSGVRCHWPQRCCLTTIPAIIASAVPRAAEPGLSRVGFAGELAERHAINRDQGVEQSHCTKATGALSLHQTRPNVVRATQTNRRLRFAP